MDDLPDGRDVSFDVGDIDSVLKLSKQADTAGFDLVAGKTWIYPTNYPLRDYQYRIVEAALFRNTLVSLPTGLGKTFIAAVVMYNFYRWYPTGKVVFMAPTRPLVKQQVDACYNIMAIPENVTAEVTGTKLSGSRASLWKEKRVFFITPQILQNDLDTMDDLAAEIRCVVLDEAHKAHGKHAYCEVVRKLHEKNKYFRVLALSATPGSNFNTVREVVSNLLISHIEHRTDESPDVAPYVFSRSLETIVVSLGNKIQAVRDQYERVLDVYVRPLLQANVLSGDCATLTKGRILMILKEFKERGRAGSHYSFLLRNLNICVTLYHGYELLVRHGLRSFLAFLEESMRKPLINSISQLSAILDDVRVHLGPSPCVQLFPDGSVPEVDPATVFGHPKFYRLAEVLMQHFMGAGGDGSRAMVFCEFRESVMEAYALLLKHRPRIRPRVFIGQGAITQAQQILSVKMFRSGACNTLVCTCIGEEGLDVGEVDLIVCFDISSKSPIRMVQRMGRTGRKRDGRVVALVTQGREQQLLQECLAQRGCVTSVLGSRQLAACLYQQNPLMVPAPLQPACRKMHITIRPLQARRRKQNGRSALQDLFGNMNAAEPSLDVCGLGEVPAFDSLPRREELWCATRGELSADTAGPRRASLCSNLEQQRALQPFSKIGHSADSLALVSLLQIADNLRFNLPTSQQSVKLSQFNERIEAKKKRTDSPPKAAFVQKDIRDIFKGIKSSQVHKTETEPDFSLKVLTDRLKSYTDSLAPAAGCKICSELFDCTSIGDRKIRERTVWTLPNSSVLRHITSDGLREFTDSLRNARECAEVASEFIVNVSELMGDEVFVESSNFTAEARQDGPDDTLGFFKVDSIEDIFMDEADELDVGHMPQEGFVKCLDEFEQFERNILQHNGDTTFSGQREFKCRSPAQSDGSPPKKNCGGNGPGTHKQEEKMSFKFLKKTEAVSAIIEIKDSPVKPAAAKFQFKSAGNAPPQEQFTDSLNNYFFDSVFEESNSNDSSVPVTPKQSASVSKAVSDCGLSPVLCSNDRVRTFKSHVQRKLFPQSNSTPITNSMKNVTQSDAPQQAETKSADLNNKQVGNDDFDDMFDIWDESFFEQDGVNDPNTATDKNATQKTETRNNENTFAAPEESEVPTDVGGADKVDLDQSEMIIHFDSDDDFDFVESRPWSQKITEKSPILNKSRVRKSGGTSMLSITQIISAVNDKTIRKHRELDTTEPDRPASQRGEFDRSTANNSIIDMMFRDVSVSKSPIVLSPPKGTSTDRASRAKRIKLNLTSPQKSPAKLNKSDSPISISSDDDFDMKPRWRTKQPVRRCLSTPSCSRDPPMNGSHNVTRSQPARQPKARKVCDFIDDEAEVEEDEHFVDDSAEEFEDDDIDSSFINDSNVCDNSSVRARYLQSVKSPLMNRGVFKIPKTVPNRKNVYSQPEDMTMDSYMNDSFCVGTQESFTQCAEMSVLERAELELEEKRRKEKLNRKRKRIIEIQSDSD